MEGSLKYLTLVVVLALAMATSTLVSAQIDPECPPPGSNETKYLPHESDCTKYYVCDNGKKQLMECPDGLHWNVQINVCDQPWVAGCEFKIRVPQCPIITNPEDPPIFHPHDSDCTKYYVCDNGLNVLMECPDGLHWNAKLEVCDHPWNAGCQKPKLFSIPKAPVVVMEEAKVPLVLRIPNCPIQTNPEDPTIYYAHETDCTKYYQCTNGVAVVMDCPDGLHWNNKLQVCDFPTSAGCKTRN